MIYIVVLLKRNKTIAFSIEPLNQHNKCIDFQVV